MDEIDYNAENDELITLGNFYSMRAWRKEAGRV